MSHLSKIRPITQIWNAQQLFAARPISTVNADEISHFTALSSQWWHPTGEFTFLHRMNPARIQFVRESLLTSRNPPRPDQQLTSPTFLKDLKVLDVGCGGGIFAEALARVGGTVLGVDAAPANIQVANAHKELDDKIKNRLNYRDVPAEQLVTENVEFDVVCAMEVIEHVDDPRGFLHCLMSLVKPGGHLMLSTPNRTLLSKFITITIPENILGIITPETHHYDKYLKPEELEEFFVENGWVGNEGLTVRGCVYLPEPLGGTWKLLAKDQYWGLGELGNYFATVQRPL